jgi:hypothetical protein
MGALWHPKYDRSADVFYKRARYYADADEMRVRSQLYHPYPNHEPSRN